MNSDRALIGWLLLASACSDGSLGSGPASAQPWFVEEARERGLVFEYASGHAQRFLFPELMGGGVALFDMDGDDDLDVFLVQGGRLEDKLGGQHRLFENDGGGDFRDVTARAGLGRYPGYGQGVTAGDIDGDGDVDLYVTQVGPNLLLRNDGQGRFEEVGVELGVADGGWGTSACLIDYDRDSDLDLFVANYVDWSLATEQDCFDPTGLPDYCSPTAYEAPSRDVLLRNDGGSFVDVTEASGIAAAAGNGLGVVPGDFDGDGRLDLFVANDQNPDRLWVNRGDGTFVDRGVVAGVALSPYGGPRAGMGTDAADVDGDGDLDLLVVHMAREADGFFRNEGRVFVEQSGRAGIATATFSRTRFGVGIHDFDHDLEPDIYVANGRVNLMMVALSESDRYAEPNSLLRGLPGGTWEPALADSAGSGPLIATSRGAAFGDLDGDGALDVVVVNRDERVHLFRNVAPRRGGSLSVRLIDGGVDALGASARLVLDGRTLRRECKPGYSYCSSSDPRLHFGLGAASSVERLVVRWADGSEETFGPFQTNTRATLVRGQGH